MKKNSNVSFLPTTSKSGIFLLELVLVILFFSIASTVCIEMFIKSYTLSNDSTYLNQSVLIAENIAEAFKSEEALIKESNTQTYYFTSNLMKTDQSNYTYKAIVDYFSKNNINSAMIYVYADNTLYFNLEIKKYIPLINQKEAASEK